MMTSLGECSKAINGIGQAAGVSGVLFVRNLAVCVRKSKYINGWINEDLGRPFHFLLSFRGCLLH
jgi:hypothetical protein